MTEQQPVRSTETYQEGVCPVQSFVTDAIPVRPGDPIPPRYGRPQREGNGTSDTPRPPSDSVQ
jgi:hypothetical protein